MLICKVFIQAQGQTLQRMGLVLSNKQCFSHGQLYVALSRVTSMEGIKIYSPNTCKGPGNNFIENVVYHELLDGIIPPNEQIDQFEEPYVPEYDDFEEDEEYEMYP